MLKKIEKYYNVHLYNIYKKMYSEKECIVCFDADVEVILSPCMHSCLCKKCEGAIKSINYQCPLCRTNILTSFDITHSKKNTKICVDEVEKYITKRNEFIEKFNLRIERKYYDLVISANNLDNFNVNIDVAREVFSYYIGTDQYDPYKFSVNSEYVGAQITCSNIMKLLAENPDMKFDNLLNKGLGYSKITFPSFFKYVTKNIVPENKLKKHLEDHYFQDYYAKNI